MQKQLTLTIYSIFHKGYLYSLIEIMRFLIAETNFCTKKSKLLVLWRPHVNVNLKSLTFTLRRSKTRHNW